MKLHLVRDVLTPEFTLGRLAINGVFHSFTCEDAVRQIDGKPVEAWKIPGKTAIPRGNYIVIIDQSQRFKRELPRLLDVPGFSGIRIHPLNFATESEGCIGVGRTRLPNGVGQSRLAFADLFDKMEAAYNRRESISIEIE